jgi:hypothetical protein
MNLLGSALTAIKPRLDDTVVDRLKWVFGVKSWRLCEF